MNTCGFNSQRWHIRIRVHTCRCLQQQAAVATDRGQLRRRTLLGEGKEEPSVWACLWVGPDLSGICWGISWMHQLWARLDSLVQNWEKSL